MARAVSWLAFHHESTLAGLRSRTVQITISMGVGTALLQKGHHQRPVRSNLHIWRWTCSQKNAAAARQQLPSQAQIRPHHKHTRPALVSAGASVSSAGYSLPGPCVSGAESRRRMRPWERLSLRALPWPCLQRGKAVAAPCRSGSGASHCTGCKSSRQVVVYSVTPRLAQTPERAAHTLITAAVESGHPVDCPAAGSTLVAPH